MALKILWRIRVVVVLVAISFRCQILIAYQTNHYRILWLPKTCTLSFCTYSTTLCFGVIIVQIPFIYFEKLIKILLTRTKNILNCSSKIWNITTSSEFSLSSDPSKRHCWNGSNQTWYFCSKFLHIHWEHTKKHGNN